MDHKLSRVSGIEDLIPMNQGSIEMKVGKKIFIDIVKPLLQLGNRMKEDPCTSMEVVFLEGIQTRPESQSKDDIPNT